MGEPDASGLALRIERGRAGEAELAAVAVVLCSVLAGRRAAEHGEGTPDVPSWRRPERSAAAYRSPYSWR
ncbi:acyl-CoA carboxylase subunit epsilon [Streptomyces sp. AC602_WCS936]|uniref:acyl-CoA carboxylase subunit epsilon n=1 Tax=Streptomyces sp. AC602_WCS936 TaxID=2823685 RepID=UPI001C27DBD5|nr:acyl-CoA carboxylase subunit epsilon [Streptomyces sp. AC602_WCS936]